MEPSRAGYEKPGAHAREHPMGNQDQWLGLSVCTSIAPGSVLGKLPKGMMTSILTATTFYLITAYTPTFGLLSVELWFSFFFGMYNGAMIPPR